MCIRDSSTVNPQLGLYFLFDWVRIKLKWVNMKYIGLRSEEHTSELQSRQYLYAVHVTCLLYTSNRLTHQVQPIVECLIRGKVREPGKQIFFRCV